MVQKPQSLYATDFVEDPDENRKMEDVVREDYAIDLVVFFPRCFVPERCPAERFRGYFLCNDSTEKPCTLTYRQAEHIRCRLGEYTLATRKILLDEGLSGKVLVIPGGRQIIDVCLVYGLPRAVLGVACPPDLKEGRQKMESLGVKSFLVPVTKLEYEVNNIKKPVVQSCYENVVKDGTESYLRTLRKTVDYIRDIKSRNLTAAQYRAQKV